MAFLRWQNHDSRVPATGATLTIQCPPYDKIHKIGLRFTDGGVASTEAEIRAEIGNIRLTINGTDIINTTANALFDLYEFMGVRVGTPAGLPGYLELNLAPLLYIDPAVRDLFGLGTADVQSIQVSVTAGTLVTIDGVQLITGREAVNENLGMHCRVLDYPQNFNSTGDHTVDTLPRDLNQAYLAVLTSDGASGTQTFGECRVNSQTLIERLGRDVNAVAVNQNGQFQPAGFYAYSFTDGNLKNRLPMFNVADLRFINTFSVAPGAAGYVMTAVSAYNMPVKL